MESEDTTVSGSRALHLKAAAFERLADQLAERLYIRLIHQDAGTGLTALLRQHGWTCIPPSASATKRTGDKPKVMKGRRT